MHPGDDQPPERLIDSTSLLSSFAQQTALEPREPKGTSLATAADVPPELFDYILDHVSLNPRWCRSLYLQTGGT